MVWTETVKVKGFSPLSRFSCAIKRTPCQFCGLSSQSQLCHQRCTPRAAKQTQVRTLCDFNWIVFGLIVTETFGAIVRQKRFGQSRFQFAELWNLPPSLSRDNESQPPLNEFGLGRMQNAKSNDCKSVAASPSSLVCSFPSYMRQLSPGRFFVNVSSRSRICCGRRETLQFGLIEQFKKRVLIKSPTLREWKKYHTNNET